MKDVKNLLVAVDVQNDFISGTLGSEKACETLEMIKKFLTSVKKEYPNVKLLTTMDTHAKETYMSSREGKMLPVLHCVWNEDGWQLAFDTIPDDTIIKSNFMSSPATMRETLSALLGSNISYYDNNVFIFGYCTSICVIANALLLRQILESANIYIVEDLCADISDENHAAALKVAQANQILVTNTDGACELLKESEH